MKARGLAAQHAADWTTLFSQRGFRYLFAAIFISLFGSGLNFAGVTWYILERTDSTVAVSLATILTTLPGLVVPPFAGVLIDRVDRRHLGIVLDLARGMIVFGTGALIYFGETGLWVVYAMNFLLGVGFSFYWSTANALVQEVAPPRQLVAGNAAVLVAVQTGMLTAGAVVGFFYERAGIAGILAIDAATYLAATLALFRMRRGHLPPRARPASPALATPATGRVPAPPAAPPALEGPPPASETGPLLVPVGAPGLVSGFVAELREGFRYLRGEHHVLAMGLVYSSMMAGVISSSVLIVALARDVLGAGPRGYGYMEGAWALGAITGGFATGILTQRAEPRRILLASLATLAAGHVLFPYAPHLAVAVGMNAAFGICRALAGVVTQSSIMSIVPRGLMGRTQAAFSFLSTLLQVMMSFSLGWLAEWVNLPVAFGVLGALYAGAFVAAFRYRPAARALPIPS
ncbi:MAG: MFS transporter [Gemmatimonadetes bacterium]|nr:MFS transporter [Gemmatimonadota bacterium]